MVLEWRCRSWVWYHRVVTHKGETHRGGGYPPQLRATHPNLTVRLIEGDRLAVTGEQAGVTNSGLGRVGGPGWWRALKATLVVAKASGSGWRRRLVAALVVAVLAVGLAPVGVLSPAPAEAQTAPGKPTGLSASPGFKAVTLSWNNPSNSNITQYQFQQRIAGSSWGSVWDLIPGSGANSTAYVVAGLTNGVTYDFRIRAIAGLSNSAASDVVSATPFDSPAAPSNLVASAGDGRVALSWDNPFNSNIFSYQFRYASGTLSSSDSWKPVVGSDASTTSHLVTGLTNGTQYTFQIRPIGRNFVRGLESVMVTATPEAGLVLAPYGFRLAGYGSESLMVSWDDPSNNAITGYQYRIGSGVPYSWGNWTEINNSSASTVSHTLGSLVNGVRYGVQVRAVLGAKVSQPSRVVYGYPAADVSGLATRRGDTRVTLEWTRVSNAGIDGFEYQIIEGQTSGEWTAIPGSDGGTRSFTVLGLTNGTAYKFKVRTTQGRLSATAAEVGPVTPAAGVKAIAAAPANFRATRWFNTGFEVQWDEPDNAAVTGYQYSTSRTSDPEGGWYGWAAIPGDRKTTTFQRSSGFANKTAVYVRIRAVVGSTPGIASRPVLIVPNAPVVLSPNAGDKQVTLSWPDPENSYIVGWEYSARQALGTITLASRWTLIPNSDATTTSHTVDNVNGTLINDATFYNFRVRPVFGAGLTGALSNQVQSTPTAARKAKPAAPRNFRVTSFTYDTSTSKLDAVFSSADLSNPNITNYKWTLRRVSAENPHVNHTSTGRTLRIAQIDADIAHEACVRAAIKISEGNFVDGFPSCIRFTTYPPPTGLTAQASTSQVKLSWTDPNVDAIAWYQYRVGTGEIGSIEWQAWNGVPNSNADTTTHTVGGLTNGTQYRFQLRAGVTGQPPTPPSTIVTATPVLPDRPAKLANVSVTVGNQSVTLGWDNPNSDVVDGYEYRQGTGDPLSWGEWTAFSGRFTGARLQRVVVGLTNGTAYSFQIRATAGTVKGASSDTVTGTPVAPPAKPTGLSATGGVNQVTLSWSDPSNSSITRYEFRQRVTGTSTWDSWTEISNSDADTTSHTVTGLTGGTAYDFQIQALAGIAVGTRSDVVSATPLLPDPPAKLANVRVKPAPTRVTVFFDEPSNSAITGYQYRQRVGTSGVWSGWNDVAEADVGRGQIFIASLTNGVTYDFQVRAVIGNVKGVASDVVSGTPFPPPAKPTGLSATGGVNQVTLSWSDPSNSNITAYQFRQRVTGSNTWDAWTTISNSDADTTSHTVSGLTGGTAYDFQIRPRVDLVLGTASDTVSATPSGFVVSVVAADLMESESSGTRSGVFRVSVSPVRSVAVALRFCFESSFTTSSFTVSVGGSQVSLDSNGCVDREGAGGSVNQITFTVNGTNDSVDEPDEVVTVTVLEDPDNTLPAGVVIDSDNDEASIKIRDDDATVVSLARVGSGAIREGGTAEFTVGLSRALVAGETVDVPLSVGGTNVGVADWSLALKTGQSVNTGVTLSGETTATPKVSFSGAAAQTATLVLSALIDDDTSVETFTVALGPDGTGANGFDVATLATNVGGGADPHASNKTFDLTVNNPSPAAALSGLTAAAGNTQVTLSWDDPSNSDIASYEYRQGTGDTVSWNNWTAIPNSDADTTSHTVTGLTNGTQYSFQIRAVWSGVAGTASTTVTATPEVLVAITPVGIKLDTASLVEGELLAVTVERQSAGEAVTIPINLVIDNVGTVASSPVRISAGARTAGATLKAPNDRVDEATQEAWRVELGTLPTIYTPAPTTPDTTPGAPPAHEQLLGVQHFTVLDNDPTVVTLAASENNNGPVTEGASKQFTITLNRGLVAGETLPVPLVFGGTATLNSDYSVACPTTAPVGVACSNNNLNRSDTPRVTFTGPPEGVTATTLTLTLNVATDDYLETDTATEVNNDIRTGTETIHVTLGELNDTSGNGLGGGATAVNNLEAFTITDTTDPTNAIPSPPDPVTPDNTTEPEATAPVYRVPTSLIADVRSYAAETHNGIAHVTRWQQVLLAFGDTVPGFTGTPITLTEAQIYARQFWNIRWDPVVEALQQLNNNPQPQNPEPTTPDVYTVPASLIADVRSYAAETHNGTAHVTRWQQVLLAFGQTVPGFTGTPITLTEAQTYAQQYWSVRWDPVVNALQQLANNPPPPPQSKDPQIDPQPQPEPVPPEPVLPRIGITTHTNNITEGQNATFTLTAVPPPTTNLDVTVNITTTGNYGITTSTHTTTIDTTGTGTLTIATTNDNTDEPNGTITITLTTNTTYTIDTTNSTATININDDDAPTQTTNTPIISITDRTITEGDQTLGDLAYLNLYPVTVTLNQPHNKSVWISFTITHLGTGPGYATPHQDFAPRKLRSFIIPTGTTTKNIYVHIKNDNTKEPNETFQITLHNPLRAQIGDGQATITIKDND